MTVQRIVGPVNAIAIEQSGAHIGQTAMPYLVRIFGQRQTCDFARSIRIEQAKLDFFRTRREQREIHAVSVIGRAQRIGLSLFEARPGAHRDVLSGFSTSTPSGGNASEREFAMPCAGRFSLCTAPILPALLPP